MTADQGIIVFSTGRKDRRSVLTTLASIQRHAPHIRCLLLTDEPSSHPFVWCSSMPERWCYAERLAALRRSSFNTTLVLDDDVCLTAPLPDLTKMLAGFSAAFAVDPMAPTLKTALDGHAKDSWLPNEEFKLMQTYPEDAVHYNSGVMLLSAEAQPLMNRWMLEWSRFGEANQMALIRAIAHANGSGFRLGVLPPEMNTPYGKQHAGTRIVHFLRHKEDNLDTYRRATELEPLADPVNAAWRFALERGQHGRTHYETVSKVIRNSWSMLGDNPNLVVFGYGPDSNLWHEQTRSMGGTSCFVEDKPRWITKGAVDGLTMIQHVYKSQRGVPFSTTDGFVDLIHKLPTCNIVLVDGPHSHMPESPGREESIKAAAMLSQMNRQKMFVVVVAGYHRPHEHVACSIYLGDPMDVRTDEKGSTALWIFPAA